MTEPQDIDVVSITVSGTLSQQVDIQKLADDNPFPISDYNPELNASLFRFETEGELLILYMSGKYILRGGDDYDRIEETNNRFLSELSDFGIDTDNTKWDITNIVAVGELEQKINLNTLLIELGLDVVEYEPEQFPGLIYRPDKTPCVLLVFSSGKVVITGGQRIDDNQKAYSLLSSKLAKSLV